MKLVPADDAARLEAFLLSGDTRAERWIKPLLQDGLPAQAYGRQLLIANDRAPMAVTVRGRQVCTCLDVSEAQIGATLAECTGAADVRLAELQARLKCGTQCGSCLPELRRFVQTSLKAA
jgi:assimilatory nitrate reductase catalytic subunit